MEYPFLFPTVQNIKMTKKCESYSRK